MANQGSGTNLANGAEVTLINGLTSLGNNRIYVLAAATGSFRLDIQISVDSGANWICAKSVLDAANNDGTYTQSAELDQTAATFGKVVLHNDSGGNINYVWDAREYNNVQH
jgi:hypothetical protein